MDTGFCVGCLDEAVLLYAKPVIFNTDQCSQFMSEEFTEALTGYGIRIIMDGKGR
jgi:putative transposase